MAYLLSILRNSTVCDRLLVADYGRSARLSVPGCCYQTNERVLLGAPSVPVSVAFRETGHNDADIDTIARLFHDREINKNSHRQRLNVNFYDSAAFFILLVLKTASGW